MKQNAFTLVELLAVIFLMGVIIAIAIPAVSRIQTTGDQRLFETTRETVESAAELYFQDNSNKTAYKNIGALKGNSGVITIGDLINGNYLTNSVVDNLTDQKVNNNAKIRVVNIGNKQYEFSFTYPLPVIVFTTGAEVTVSAIGNYQESNYETKAYDKDGNDISSRIQKSSPVFDNKLNCYVVKYNVTDSNQEKANETIRKIYVTP